MTVIWQKMGIGIRLLPNVSPNFLSQKNKNIEAFRRPCGQLEPHGLWNA